MSKTRKDPVVAAPQPDDHEAQQTFELDDPAMGTASAVAGNDPSEAEVIVVDSIDQSPDDGPDPGSRVGDTTPALTRIAPSAPLANLKGADLVAALVMVAEATITLEEIVGDDGRPFSKRDIQIAWWALTLAAAIDGDEESRSQLGAATGDPEAWKKVAGVNWTSGGQPAEEELADVLSVSVDDYEYMTDALPAPGDTGYDVVLVEASEIILKLAFAIGFDDDAAHPS